jgi:hypothetical protein
MRVSLKALIVCMALVAPARAHHGGGVEYFMDQTRGPVTGTVTAFAFTFPHPYIEFDVKTDGGAIEKWSAVFQPTPTNLRAAGWTRTSVKPGDTLTVSGPPHKSAATVIFARRVEVNGKLLEQGGGGN